MISTYGNFFVLEICKFRFRGSSAKSENPNTVTCTLIKSYFPFILYLFFNYSYNRYSAQIMIENDLFCRQNARLKNRLLCSKFCRQNLSKPTVECSLSMFQALEYYFLQVVPSLFSCITQKK